MRKLHIFLFIFAVSAFSDLSVSAQEISVTADCVALFKGADLSLSKDSVTLKQGRPGLIKKSFEIVSPSGVYSYVSFAAKIRPYLIDNEFILELSSSALSVRDEDTEKKPFRRKMKLHVSQGSSAVYEILRIPDLDCNIILALTPKICEEKTPTGINELLSIPNKEIEFTLSVYQINDGTRNLLEKPRLRTYIDKPVGYEYSKSVPQLLKDGSVALVEEKINLTFLAREIYDLKLYFEITAKGKTVYPLNSKKNFYINWKEDFEMGTALHGQLEFFSDDEKNNGFLIEFCPYF